MSVADATHYFAASFDIEARLFLLALSGSLVDVGRIEDFQTEELDFGSAHARAVVRFELLAEWKNIIVGFVMVSTDNHNPRDIAVINPT